MGWLPWKKEENAPRQNSNPGPRTVTDTRTVYTQDGTGTESTTVSTDARGNITYISKTVEMSVNSDEEQ